jgi:hypothetical protein
MRIPKSTFAALIAAIAIICPKAKAGDPSPNSYEYWKSYNWASGDLNYIIRQAQLRSEQIERENLQRRLDRFLLNQGY